ncbi:MAG: iron chelate uptake ABC transporter family permease subunit [Dehalococcoidia bacterium]|nr:iron chelate uptake ABC transporter family permease subunit [Dehalococcoidia bacterium]
MVDWATDPLQFEFFRRALWEVMLLGFLCGVVGSFVVLRGLAFIGDALAHAVFPGVVIAFLLSKSFFLGGIVFGLLTSLLVAVLSRNKRISEDTAIGVLFAGMFALGIVLISSTSTYTRDLSSLLIGNVLGISDNDLLITLVTAIVVLALIAAFYKELQLASFDPVSAAAMGYPTFALELLLLGLITVTIVVSIQAVGTILVLAFLVTPAATAHLLVDRLLSMMVLGGAIGAVNGVIGLFVSYHFDVAGGGSIVLVTTAVFFLVFALSPQHGLLARYLRRDLHGPVKDDWMAPGAPRPAGGA